MGRLAEAAAGLGIIISPVVSEDSISNVVLLAPMARPQNGDNRMHTSSFDRH